LPSGGNRKKENTMTFFSATLSRRLPAAALLILLAALALLTAPPARAATITVCPSGCDFANVALAVDAAAAGDTIDIAAGTYHHFAGPIVIDKALTLRGAGMDVTIIDRAPSDTGRIFTIEAGAEVLIEALTITGANTSGSAEIKTSACAGNGGSMAVETVSLVQDTPFSFDFLTTRSNAAVSPCETNPFSGSIQSSQSFSGYGGLVQVANIDDHTDVQGPAVVTETIDMSLRGGGIYNGGQLTLRQVKITQNTLTASATSETVVYDDTESATATTVIVVRLLGGGVYNANTGSLTLERSAITDNTVTGAINATTLATLDSGATATAHADTYLVAGGGLYNAGSLTMRDSTISGNTATATVTAAAATAGAPASTTVTADPVVIGSGGLANAGSVHATNSTISGNTITPTLTGDEVHLYAAGGLYDNRQPSTLNFTTVADNELVATVTGAPAGVSAGGVVTARAPDVPETPEVEPFVVAAPRGGVTPTPPGGNLKVFGSIVTGNTGGDCASEGSLFVHAGYSLSGDGSCDIPQGDAGLGPLANNGGPTETHLPAANGDAIDRVPLSTCASYSLTTDQRGAPRPLDNGCDAGSVEVEKAGGDIFVSTTAAGATGDGLAFGAEDILAWDGSEWSVWFDGSAAGLTPNGLAKHNVNAIWIPDPAGDDVVMSFAQNRRNVPDISVPVDGTDLVYWDGAGFSFWFDGSDVGLTILTAEKIDGLHVLDGAASPIGSDCDAYLLISTAGPGKVPNHSGGTLNFSGEDVLGFCAQTLGTSTTGLWHKFLDGSDQGMPKNSTDSISLSADGETLYLTTKGTFNVDGVIGGHSMIYAYDFATQTFSGPLFIAANEGMAKKIDALQQ
jgi:hypothetical protein